MSGGAEIGFYVALLALIFVGALWRPELSVTGVVCIFGLKQWGQSASSWIAAHGTFTNYAVGAIVLCALGAQLLRGQCILCNLRKEAWAVIALYCYALLSLLWTPSLDTAADLWSHAAPYLLTVVVLAPLTVNRIAQLRTSYVALAAIGGALVLVMLVFGKWGGRGLVMGSGASELETNPLAIASLAGSVATAALFIGWRRFASVGWVLRLMLVAACLAVIVRSGSRGQFLAALGALCVTLPVAFRLNQIRGFVPIVVAMVVIAGASAYAAKNYIRPDDARWQRGVESHAVDTRLEMGEKLLSRWSESPVSMLFGLGNSAAYDPSLLGSYPHDVALETLCEEGLLGFALYLRILWLAACGAFRALRIVREQPQRRGVLATASASFLFMLIVSLKQGSMISSAWFFLAAILLADMPALAITGEPAGDASEPTEAAPGPLFANVMR